MRLMIIGFYLVTAGVCWILAYNCTTYDVETSTDYLYVSDDNNNMRRVYNFERVNKNIVNVVNNIRSHSITYMLYTRENPQDAQILVYNDRNITISNFDPDKVTVFLIHGWLGDKNSTINTVLKEAFLQDDDVNVIVVVWCKIACTVNYFTVIASVPGVGRQLGLFIKWLTTFGLSYKNVHVVGHSLGAHVAGRAGRETDGKVQRITGLDPAGPYWEKLPTGLQKSDGQYVEVIHTNTDCLGYKKIIGHADFFPNGGGSAADCSESACSHIRACHYMAYSVIYKDIYGLPCADIHDMKLDNCKGEPYLMGTSDLTKNRSGIFRVNAENILKTNYEIGPGQRRSMYRRFFVAFPMKYDCRFW